MHQIKHTFNPKSTNMKDFSCKIYIGNCASMIKVLEKPIIYFARFHRKERIFPFRVSPLRRQLGRARDDRVEARQVAFDSLDTVRLVEGRSEKYGKRGRASNVQSNGSGQSNLFLGKQQLPDRRSWLP